MTKRFLAFFILVGLILTGCGKSAVPTAVVVNAPVATLVPLGTPSGKYGLEVARPLIRDFTNFGPREAGSAAEAQTAQYITAILTAIGYSPETQPFSVTTSASAADQSLTSANVIALKKGTSEQEIIVGSHYDSKGAGLGADDNASGVAVMLDVAKMLINETTPYTIRFIAFGAGEAGLLGSYAYINGMSQEEFENVIAMIDLDSLVAGNIAYVYSDEGQQSIVRDWALEWATGNGINLQTVRNVNLTDPSTGLGSSDYAPFREVGIPFAYFETADWTLGNQKGLIQVETRYGENGVIRHTRYDTLEYLDATFPGRVDEHLNLFITILYNLLMQFEAPIR